MAATPAPDDKAKTNPNAYSTYGCVTNDRTFHGGGKGRLNESI